MKKKYLFVLLGCMLSLVSCNQDNKKDSSPKIESSYSDPIIIEDSRITALKEFREELLQLEATVSKKTYKTSQVDYYGIEIESSEEGTVNVYQDNFIVTEFSQSIADEEAVTGRREMGITGSKVNPLIYQIDYYSENDEANKTQYFYNTPENATYLLNVGFVQSYIFSIINLTIDYLSTKGLRITLQTNFDMIDLSKDGVVTLKYRFTNTSIYGVKEEEVQRDDVLTIQGGKIIKSNTTMLYSLKDGINSQYMEQEVNYVYDEIPAYNGEKLDPANYPTKQ